MARASPGDIAGEELRISLVSAMIACIAHSLQHFWVGGTEMYVHRVDIVE